MNLWQSVSSFYRHQKDIGLQGSRPNPHDRLVRGIGEVIIPPLGEVRTNCLQLLRCWPILDSCVDRATTLLFR